MRNQKIEKKEISVTLDDIPCGDNLKDIVPVYNKIKNVDDYRIIATSYRYRSDGSLHYYLYGIRMENDEEFAKRLSDIEKDKKIMQERYLKRKKTILANKKKQLERLQKTISKLEKTD